MALLDTLTLCNKAACFASEVAYKQDVKSRNKYALHAKVYSELRATRGLGSRATDRVIAKVADAYATQRSQIKSGLLSGRRKGKATSKPISFRSGAAQAFGSRNLSWQLDKGTPPSGQLLAA